MAGFYLSFSWYHYECITKHISPHLRVGFLFFVAHPPLRLLRLLILLIRRLLPSSLHHHAIISSHTHTWHDITITHTHMTWHHYHTHMTWHHRGCHDMTSLSYTHDMASSGLGAVSLISRTLPRATGPVCMAGAVARASRKGLRRHLCGTLLLDTLSWHFCGTLLLDTSYLTLL